MPRHVTKERNSVVFLCAVILMFVVASSVRGAVTSIGGGKGWVLETKESQYVISVTAERTVINSWWGSKLAKGDHELRPMHLPPFSDGPARQEYAGWGGMYYAEPSLKVRFADGNRDLRLRFQTAEMRENELILNLRDEHYPFEVALHYRVVAEHDLIERWAEIRNKGTEAVRLGQVGSALWHLPRRED